ncbi:MAG: hypothetical protein KBC95_04095 [Candidatus Peribacteraceae bacterium]|nr:hypothetical protein [Candidatus Peribacteraceae bacterium]
MTALTVYADRVKDTTTTTGTGDLTLSGSAPTGFQTFNAAIGQGPLFYYAISASGSAEWEVGRGYLSAATTLVRQTVLASSNAGAVVNLSSGTKDAIVTWPAWVATRSSTLAQDMTCAKGIFLP